jgi:protein-S-isoprenylcysteine O-methyltransferase Ste14
MTDAIILGWVVLCLVMLVHRRLRQERVAERAAGTWVGIVIQALGFSAIWTLRRAAGTPAEPAASLLAALADASGLVAILLGIAAVWTLGRHWSVEGRVLPEHALIQHGPYARVRHPIYTAMFGMLLATGLSVSSPLGLLAGVAVFLAGTAVRVRFEEQLLRRRFGAAFEQYAAAVPAFLPRLAGGGPRRAGERG